MYYIYKCQYCFSCIYILLPYLTQTPTKREITERSLKQTASHSLIIVGYYSDPSRTIDIISMVTRYSLLTMLVISLNPGASPYVIWLLHRQFFFCVLREWFFLCVWLHDYRWWFWRLKKMSPVPAQLCSVICLYNVRACSFQFLLYNRRFPLLVSLNSDHNVRLQNRQSRLLLASTIVVFLLCRLPFLQLFRLPNNFRFQQFAGCWQLNCRITISSSTFVLVKTMFQTQVHCSSAKVQCMDLDFPLQPS